MQRITSSVRLPDFVRCSWTSDRSREVWQPRLEAIREAWPQVAIRAVATGCCQTAIRAVPAHLIFRLQAEARAQGVSVAALGVRGLAMPAYAAGFAVQVAGRPFLYDVAFGSEELCRDLEALWEQSAYAGAYELAGSPACCITAFAERVASQRIDALSEHAQPDAGLDLGSEATAEMFWCWHNLETFACPPCSPGCAASMAASVTWRGWSASFGYAEQMAWVDEVLSWPLSWTALHGIAEVKTPVLRAIWSTDVTPCKTSLRYRGLGYPEAGAIGLHFPYREAGKPMLTSSEAFRRGLENLIQIC